MQPVTGTFSARWIVPLCQPPIHHGWIRFQKGTIVALGFSPAPGPSVDLGDQALLPGLINAHTHLEFSNLQTPLGVPGISLPEWIGHVLGERQKVISGPCFPASRAKTIQRGLNESAAAGVRLIGDITTSQVWKEPYQPHWPDMIRFHEVLGLSADRQAETLAGAESELGRGCSGRVAGGISPHAPYSTAPNLIERAVRLSQVYSLPLAMHVAECPEELQLVNEATGPFRDLLEQREIWRPGLFPTDGGMLGLLRTLANAPRSLIVHGNYLAESEIDFLAEQPQMSVVFCPRTHSFFQHVRHPVAKMLDMGIRVVLGTDSRASNPDLAVWNEVRFLANHRSDLDPEAIIRMVTCDAAHSLGRTDCGRLQVGASPGLIALPTKANSAKSLWGSLCDTDPKPIVKPTDPDLSNNLVEDD